MRILILILLCLGVILLMFILALGLLACIIAGTIFFLESGIWPAILFLPLAVTCIALSDFLAAILGEHIGSNENRPPETSNAMISSHCEPL